MELIFFEEELQQTAQQLIDALPEAGVIAFHGEMGAGKTTFISALCRALGVSGPVSSPTFSIINEYATDAGEIIYHLDLYRIKSEKEAIAAGVEDTLYSTGWVFVEWPENACGLMPHGTVECSLQTGANNARKLTIKL